MSELEIHFDCKHYKGTIPCSPHKEHGVHCNSCEHYAPIDARILIIKLGAIGDVIRTTPLIRAYKKKYKNPKFTWVTLTPSILPEKEIDEILPLTLETSLYIQQASFDIAINLDKEKEACGLMAGISAKEKFGFTLINGECQAVNKLAKHKLSTGLFDDISQANKKSYCTEIFEICGMAFNGEAYLLDNHDSLGINWSELDYSKKIIGLNTGCGDRWTTRLWSIEKWTELANTLSNNGHEVVLLGGAQEDERNKQIAANSTAKYLGHFSLDMFINLVNQCELVITQVTMGMHITIALGKKIVLMNNIFNANEFDLYGKGEIVEPKDGCICYYRGTCKTGTSCMSTISTSEIVDSMNRILG